MNTRMRLALCLMFAATLCLPAPPAQAADLLDYVIEAIDPNLAPARPLIECLAGGGSAEHCALEAGKKQALGTLPIGPGDDRIQRAVGVFTAAREERWFDVMTIGGEVVAKSVSCAMLPLQGPVKGTACSIVGWVITNASGTLDQAWVALTGPDWWALVDLLGSAACQLIPGDGAAGYAKDVLCGPLAAVLVEVKQVADALAKGVVAGADELEKLVFGNDSHMPYDRYFELYWQPWYHYATAKTWRGEGLGPAVGQVYDYCVNYFDSHNQYRSTAHKTCSDLKKKFDRHVQGFANALPVAVNGYFETIARPAIRGYARVYFGEETQTDLPGENLFAMNCVFQIRQRFPFPEPDDTPCIALETKAKDLAGGSVGVLYQNLAKHCRSQVQQQTLDPTVWQMACDDLRTPYRQAYTGETLKLMKTIGDLKPGCQLADPKTADGLRLDCESFAAHAECLEALLPNGDTYCVKPKLYVADQRAGDQSVMGGAQVSAAGLGAAAGASASGDNRPATAGRQTPAPGTTGRPSSGPLTRTPPASALTGYEAEDLLASQRVQWQGGEAVAQPMAGFGPGWSGDAQLFWHGGAVGATLDLLVDVPRDGAWDVEILLTRAPDYAELGFEVDHHPVEQRFDGYAPHVAGPVAVSLGRFAMMAGPRPVSLKVTGRNPAASGWLAGIDRIVLRPVVP